MEIINSILPVVNIGLYGSDDSVKYLVEGVLANSYKSHFELDGKDFDISVPYNFKMSFARECDASNAKNYDVIILIVSATFQKENTELLDAIKTSMNSYSKLLVLENTNITDDSDKLLKSFITTESLVAFDPQKFAIYSILSKNKEYFVGNCHGYHQVIAEWHFGTEVFKQMRKSQDYNVKFKNKVDEIGKKSISNALENSGYNNFVSTFKSMLTTTFVSSSIQEKLKNARDYFVTLHESSNTIDELDNSLKQLDECFTTLNNKKDMLLSLDGYKHQDKFTNMFVPIIDDINKQYKIVMLKYITMSPVTTYEEYKTLREKTHVFKESGKCSEQDMQDIFDEYVNRVVIYLTSAVDTEDWNNIRNIMLDIIKNTSMSNTENVYKKCEPVLNKVLNNTNFFDLNDVILFIEKMYGKNMYDKYVEYIVNYAKKCDIIKTFSTKFLLQYQSTEKPIYDHLYQWYERLGKNKSNIVFSYDTKIIDELKKFFNYVDSSKYSTIPSYVQTKMLNDIKESRSKKSQKNLSGSDDDNKSVKTIKTFKSSFSKKL